MSLHNQIWGVNFGALFAPLVVTAPSSRTRASTWSYLQEGVGRFTKLSWQGNSNRWVPNYFESEIAKLSQRSPNSLFGHPTFEWEWSKSDEIWDLTGEYPTNPESYHPQRLVNTPIGLTHQTPPSPCRGSRPPTVPKAVPNFSVRQRWLGIIIENVSCGR